MSLQLPGCDGVQWESQTHVVGSGLIDSTTDGIRVVRDRCSAQIYSNAQFDDYQLLQRRHFPWMAPLRLEVRARFSHTADRLIGTAGFGFWNAPFMFPGTRTPALPRAAWFFFSSQPSNMALARDVQGYGWKAATIDAQRARFFILAPTAPIAIPLMHIECIYQRLWPMAQNAIGVAEAEIGTDMTAWHTYTLAWNRRSVEFHVDGVCVLATDQSPNGRLGFVLWIDNQYMVVTPQGRLRHGLLASATRQWMEVSYVHVHRL